MPTLLSGTTDEALDAAARRLAAGGLVAFPTETVYGLGARADDDAAVAGIFAAKGRPSDHPLIVHVADAEAAGQFTDALPAAARRLMERFWPGPVTVIVPRRPGVAAAAAGGQDSIGLRCPDHPLALQLLRRAAALGVPGVAAPSANRFGRISPTLARHVVDEFDSAPDTSAEAARAAADLLVLDGGPCTVGIESAIVDCTADPPALLRPGALSRADLGAALSPAAAEGGPDALGGRNEASPRASGTLAAHYAPRARLRLMDAAQLRSALDLIGSELQAAPGSGPVLALYSRSLPAALAAPAAGTGPLPARVLHRRMPSAARAAAHQLFADLRELDASGVRLIWVEAVPDDAEWEGVRDRLNRAAAAG